MEALSCPGCRARDARITELEGSVAELQAQVRDLQARLNSNSSNSSIPPSANPLNAPKPVVIDSSILWESKPSDQLTRLWTLK